MKKLPLVCKIRKSDPTRTFLQAALLLSGLGCHAPEIHTARRVRVMMDTAAAISIYLPDARFEARALADIDTAFQEMARLDSLLSFYREDSEVGALNRWAAMLPDDAPENAGAFAVSAEMDTLLRTAVRISGITSGAFDVTIAPLMQLWGFGTAALRLPAAEEIQAKLALVNFRHLLLEAAAPSFTNGRHTGTVVRWRRSGMGIDLGGIAKGYILERGLQVLQARGYQDAMLEAGGDLCAIASPLTAGQRHIWIRHPRQEDQLFARFRMSGGAVSTSGDYERYFEENGRRYHHILDPRTGYPAGTDSAGRTTVSATVTGPSALITDAFSTAMFVLGPERAVALADSLPEIETVILYQENGRLQWRASRELAGKLEMISN